MPRACKEDQNDTVLGLQNQANHIHLRILCMHSTMSLILFTLEVDMQQEI